MTSPSLGRAPALVSVVIPCYNSARFVAAAARSALDQSYDPLEVIVVNDGSTDGFDEAIAPLRDMVRVVNQANAGLAASRNRGIAESHGAYIAFLDADDVWRLDKIERQMSTLESQPDCVLVHTRPAYIGPAGEPVGRKRQPWWEHPAEGACTCSLLAHNTVIVSSVLVRRAALGEKPFASGVAGCEDWYLWLQLSLRARLAYIDEPMTFYRLHDNSMSRDALLMQRSAVAVCEKFLKEDLSPDVRRAALRRYRLAMRSLAQIEFATGSLERARDLFARAVPAIGPRDLARTCLTLLPTRIGYRVRDWRRRRHQRNRDRAVERSTG